MANGQLVAVWLQRKSAFQKMLSVTLNFKSMTLKMSPVSCGPGNE